MPVLAQFVTIEVPVPIKALAAVPLVQLSGLPGRQLWQLQLSPDHRVEASSGRQAPRRGQLLETTE